MKLFAVLLGGSFARKRLGEDNEIVFIVAKDEKAARKASRKKWQGSSKRNLHIDAIEEISVVDGYEVILKKVAGNKGDRRKISDDYHKFE